MQHVKYYNQIRLPYDRLIKKCISYANPTEQPKTITISTPSPYIRVKNSKISIKPYSSGNIQLRLFFDRTLGPAQRGDLLISDGPGVQHLVFQFVLE